MTWIRYHKESGLCRILIEDEREIMLAPFYNQETGEYRFFGKTKLEEIGEAGILKILNSPTPTSSESGE